jgi:hypothetical protein
MIAKADLSPSLMNGPVNSSGRAATFLPKGKKIGRGVFPARKNHVERREHPLFNEEGAEGGLARTGQAETR